METDGHMESVFQNTIVTFHTELMQNVKSLSSISGILSSSDNITISMILACLFLIIQHKTHYIHPPLIVSSV